MITFKKNKGCLRIWTFGIFSRITELKKNTLTIKLLKSFLNINVQAQESNASEYKERTKEVAHKVKHYGAFGEDYLGIIQLLSRYYLGIIQVLSRDYLGIIQVLSTGLSRGLSRYYLQDYLEDYLGIIYRIFSQEQPYSFLVRIL